MATHKSALKSWRQSERRRLRNQAVKSALRTLTKKVRSSKTREAALKNLLEAKVALDKAGQRKILHKNNAARKISRLTIFVNKLPVAA